MSCSKVMTVCGGLITIWGFELELLGDGGFILQCFWKIEFDE